MKTLVNNNNDGIQKTISYSGLTLAAVYGGVKLIKKVRWCFKKINFKLFFSPPPLPGNSYKITGCIHRNSEQIVVISGTNKHGHKHEHKT